MIEMINGYACRDCSDVALAKRNVDPAHPKDGPNGADRNDAVRRDDAVTFGGSLAAPAPGAADRVAPTRESQADQRANAKAGARLDISV